MQILNKPLPRYEGKTALVVATGPSMDTQRFQLLHGLRAFRIRNDQYRIFTVNNALFDLKTVADVHYANNVEWWTQYATHIHNVHKDRAELHGCEPLVLTTYRKDVADDLGAYCFRGIWAAGLSKDPTVLHFGHGGGYEVLGVAYACGIRDFVLFGYDMKYPAAYDSTARKTGGKRHYFGEYPRSLQHWPTTGLSIDANGVMVGLFSTYRALLKHDEIRIRIVAPTALPYFEVINDNPANLVSTLA